MGRDDHQFFIRPNIWDERSVVMSFLCRIKITGLLPEDAEFTPVVSSSSSTPDLTKKPGNCERFYLMPCSSMPVLQYFEVVI